MGTSISRNPVGSNLGYVGTWTGPDAVRRNLFEPPGRDGSNCLVTPDAFVVEEPIVVAFGTYAGMYRDGSKSIVAPFVHRWEVIDGKVKNFQQYTDTALIAAVQT
jgi:ketosteroid isomerase-like protein